MIEGIMHLDILSKKHHYKNTMVTDMDIIIDQIIMMVENQASMVVFHIQDNSKPFCFELMYCKIPNDNFRF